MADLDTKIIKQELKENYARFTIEPLVAGFGQTLGNGLRRVLLSQLGGAAVTKVKIAGAAHQFSVIPGVKEDTVELILNLKKIHFKMIKKTPTILTLSASGPGAVKASEIVCPTGIEVVNKDLEIADLADKKAKLEMEITVEYGKGYNMGEQGSSLGTIMVDASFSPVDRVNFRVEDARVGRLTDFDRLVIEIWTNGTIDPLESLKQSAAILSEQYSTIAEGTPVEKIESGVVNEIKAIENVKVVSDDIYLEELGLPTRTLNTLKKANVETVLDVDKIGEEGISKIKHVGPKTVEMILKKIKKAKEKK